METLLYCQLNRTCDLRSFSRQCGEGSQLYIHSFVAEEAWANMHDMSSLTPRGTLRQTPPVDLTSTSFSYVRPGCAQQTPSSNIRVVVAHRPRLPQTCQRVDRDLARPPLAVWNCTIASTTLLSDMHRQLHKLKILPCTLVPPCLHTRLRLCRRGLRALCAPTHSCM